MSKIISRLVLFAFILCDHHVRTQATQTQTDIRCKLKLDGNIRQLLVNETWTNVATTPCIVYKCLVNGRIEKNIQSCNTSCEDNLVYTVVPGECCGRCESTVCVDEQNKRGYREGEVWKGSDNCTINECLRNRDKLVTVSYKKNCPKLRNCPVENIETRNCCQYCNRFERSLKQFKEVEVTDRDSYRSHPCLRDCVKGQSLTCNYEFIVESFETMSKACYNCPKNKTDCFRPHCITGDGMKRSIIVVNRMLPGPVIEVCVNDTVVVDVKNHLMTESTTIHWHGMHQKKTPYMDGVPHISQCPILPGQTFRYTFLAENSGTHMWHSHLGLQRNDGVVGAFIVRHYEEVHENLYDFDWTEHIMLTNDWTHVPATSAFTAHHHGHGDNKPSNILINGRGKYFGNMTATNKVSAKKSIIKTTKSSSYSNYETPTESFTDDYELLTTTSNDYTTDRSNFIINYTPHHDREKRDLLPLDSDSPYIPYEVFYVNSGHRYRFRHINAGFLNCPIEISIDNHTIIAIATDGNDIQPQEVTFLVTYAGERWDFIVNANQKVGNYFIRTRGLMDCDERFTSSFQMAVLHYQGAPDKYPEGTRPSYELNRSGLTLNGLNRKHGEANYRTIAEIKSTQNQPNQINRIEPDYKFYMSYDFYGKDNPLFHNAGLYGFNQVPFGRVYTPQINHISLRMPTEPAMLVKQSIESTFCNETSLRAEGINCKETFCQCVHVLQVRLNSIVEMILIDEGVTYDANHMFHLHGHYFHVIGMDRLGKNVSREQVMELDKMKKLKRRFVDSVRKDTVTVPDGGYTIIRFYADNPGIWLMHCHIDFHAEVGMAIILKVGDFNQMPPVPNGFPTCHDYKAINEQQETSSSSIYLSNLLNIIIVLSSIILVNFKI